MQILKEQKKKRSTKLTVVTADSEGTRRFSLNAGIKVTESVDEIEPKTKYYLIMDIRWQG